MNRIERYESGIYIDKETGRCSVSTTAARFKSKLVIAWGRGDDVVH